MKKKLDPANPESTVDSDEGTTTTDPHVEEEAAEPEDEPKDELEGPSEEAPDGKDEGSDEDTEAARKSGQLKEEPELEEVFFEDEEPSAEPPKDSKAWARLRAAERDARREAAELRRKLEAQSSPSQVPDPGPEPTLEDCDYDQDILKKRVREHDAAVARKQAADAEAAKAQQEASRRAQELFDNYSRKKAELSKRVQGYQEAESAVISMMSPERQDVLLKIAEDPARLVYALGRRPDKLEELAKENDRDRFVAKLKKLEVSINVKKGTPTPPEERVSGSGSPGPAGSTLERLRAEAFKTGDYTKVNAWKRQQRERGRK